ncbi:MAG: RNA methyltransferase [Muribaculaceae bacterium]|nr:RNA methyltransferase [Muribaculaceae bacterium]
MSETFEMVAKTFQGLEGVLSDELTALGAQDVLQGRRMVSFKGDKEMMYKANFCLRTALRVLKPIYKFTSTDADDLYEQVKQFRWEDIMTESSTFSIDSTVYSESFKHSRFVTYRVKDGIADHFMEQCGKRPSIRLNSPDYQFNVHISGNDVTISLDSSGEPLYKRGWRVAQTDAPINEVLAAGIIKLSGWDGESNFVDPMCGSGTFLIEAALIAANINPGVYRQEYAFQKWPDYDADLFDAIYNDDSGEREFEHKIYGYDILGKAVAASNANIKNAGLTQYIEVERVPLEEQEAAPEKGVLITNPPYGERLTSDELPQLYATLGSKLKKVFLGYDCWLIVGSNKELIDNLGLKASLHYPLLNGDIECELREYVIFDGSFDDMRRKGGSIKNTEFRASEKPEYPRRDKDDKPRREFKRGGERGERREGGFSKKRDGERRERGFKSGGERSFKRGGERGDRGVNPMRKRREDEDRGVNPMREREDGTRVYRTERPYKEDSPRRTFSFHGPRLGEDKERPVFKGRRNGWKRRDAKADNGNEE